MGKYNAIATDSAYKVSIKIARGLAIKVFIFVLVLVEESSYSISLKGKGANDGNFKAVTGFGLRWLKLYVVYPLIIYIIAYKA